MSTSRSNSKPRAAAASRDTTKARPSQIPSNSVKNVKSKIGQVPIASKPSPLKPDKTKSTTVPAAPIKKDQLRKPSIPSRSVSKERGASIDSSNRAVRTTQLAKPSIPKRSESNDRGSKLDSTSRPSRPTQLTKTPAVATVKKPVDPKKTKPTAVPSRNLTATISKPHNSNQTTKKVSSSDKVAKAKKPNDKPHQTSVKVSTKDSSSKNEKSEKSEDTSSDSERPSTVNLSSRKGENRVMRNPDSIIANNEAVLKTNAADDNDALEAEIDYEDDFEDYESDFEANDDSESDATESEVSFSSRSDVSQESKSEPLSESIQDVPYSETAKLVENSHTKAPEILTPAQHIKIKFIPTSLSFYEAEKVVDSNVTTPMTPITITPMTPTASLFTPVTPSVSMFNFAQAELSITQKKNKTRGTELLELITLDKQTFNIYESPPANYEAFIQIFGSSNRKQVFVQTDISETQTTQTDEIDTLEKWTQNPPHGPRAVGGDLISEDGNKWNLQVNGVKLNNFITNAANLVLKILDEETKEVIHDRLKTSDKNVPFSCGYFDLNIPDFMIGFPVSQVCFSEGQPCYMLSAHGAEQNEGPPEFRDKGFICIWDLKNQSQPEYVLIPSSVASKCCFNPGNPTIIFAGMLDGSVSLWDLRESHSQHKKFAIPEYPNLTYRTATYSTAAVQWEVGHHSAIVDIQSFIYENSSSSQGSQSIYLSDNQFCSLVTLEDLGIFNIWTVVAVDPDPSGLDTDLGLAPGGKLKLLKSTSVSISNIFSPTSQFSIGLRSLGFKVQPENPHNIFLATDAGIVLHCTRQGNLSMPRIYEINQENSEVRCLAFNPHRLPYFATGCNDGSIYIHNVRSSKPIFKCLFRTACITNIQWSVIRPTVFYVLDVQSCIQVWDLSKSNTSPCFVSELSDGEVTNFCVVFDRTSDSHWSQYMVMCTSAGSLKVHKLIDSLTSVSHDEYDLMRNLMNDL